MIKFSIITPMYNSFELMSRYFQSFINQTFKDFELIIVDDSSTDDSYEKIKEFVSSVDQIQVKLLRTNKNSGPGLARNFGLSKAKGEWVTFVDNDDWVSTDMLERINEVIDENDVNCVIYDFYIKNDKIERVCSSMYHGNNGIVSMSECMAYVRNHSIGKFYRRNAIKDIEYPTLRRCEDVAFVCIAVDACEKAYYLKEPLYYYYQRNNSLSNNTKLDESDMILAFDIVENKLLEKYPKEIKEKSVTDLLYGVLLMMCKAGKDNQKIICYINEYNKKYPGWDNCEIIDYLGNAKKLFLVAAKYKQVWIMKAIAYMHSKIIG